MAEFGTRLKALREHRKITQHDLANRLRDRGFGTTQTTVSRWESGQVPRGYVARALADELGTTIDDLFADDDEEAASMQPTSDLFSELLDRAIRAEVSRQLHDKAHA